MGDIRVRFAPSPTGYLHIGGARTALFNWLFAKHYNGKFILRIEDTDIERSSKASEGTILSSLKWLGFDWDEGPEVGGDFGPYRQGERLEIYKDYAKRLIESQDAYYCYCLEEELETRRKESPGYDGRCRNLSELEQKRFIDKGRKPTVRLRVRERDAEESKIMVNDELHGRIEFDTKEIHDFIILRSDGVASYNFAVVIDDHLMQISHVIRGDDHLSNTPRQILIYQALGFDLPKFAHLPMILGEDGTRLSKRHGATSVEAYQRFGYIPEALVNYLALIGWSPEEQEKEICTIDELIQEFSLKRVSKSPAIFDMEKLNWMGGIYIRETNLERITQLSIPYLREARYISGNVDFQWLQQVVAVVKNHLSCMSQIIEHVDYFFKTEVAIDKDVKPFLQMPMSDKVLSCLIQRLTDIDNITPDIASQSIKAIGKENGINGKDLFMPIRAALTGKYHGPDLPQVMAVLGRDVCLARLMHNRYRGSMINVHES